jgi:hypothetical protein
VGFFRWFFWVFLSGFFWVGFLMPTLNPPACSDHGLHICKPQSFPPNRSPKIRERHQLFFGLRYASKEFQHPAIQTKIELYSGGFFHQIKVWKLIGRQDSMQTVIRTIRRLDLILHEGLRTLKPFQIFKNVIKKSNTYRG